MVMGKRRKPQSQVIERYAAGYRLCHSVEEVWVVKRRRDAIKFSTRKEAEAYLRKALTALGYDWHLKERKW